MTNSRLSALADALAEGARNGQIVTADIREAATILRSLSVAPQALALLYPAEHSGEAMPRPTPVAKVARAQNGAIAMWSPDGSPFDMSKYVGQTFYSWPAGADRKPSA